MFLPKAWLRHEMTQHSKCFSFFPPLKRALKPIRIFCFWYEVVVAYNNHTWSGTSFKSMKKNNWDAAKCVKRDMFQRNYKPPTHKLAYQKPNMKNEVLTALSCKCDLTFRPPEACRLHFCGELGRFRFWFSSMLLKNGRLRGQLNGFVWSALLSNHWVFYNVFIRRGYLEAIIYASAKHLVYVLHF